MSFKYKIIPVTFPVTGTTKYKLRYRKKYLGFLYFWFYLEEWNEWDQEYRIKLFNSIEEAEGYLRLQYNYISYEHLPDIH